MPQPRNLRRMSRPDNEIATTPEANPYQAPRSPVSAAADWLRSHPIGFWFFFWGELAERSSYYGMRAILALYMHDQLGFSEQNSSTTMHSFIAACYLLPLVGGWVADTFLGKYWTIVGFSLPYIVGQLILSIESVPFLFTALVLLAMGSGVIKPNISTLMGLTYDQQRPGMSKLRSDAFAMFYGAINIGAALSSFAMPWLRSKYGFSWAFLFPAGLMAVAFIIFAIGKRFYAVEQVSREPKTAAERTEQWAVLRRIGGIFIIVTFFWSIFDQSTSTWTFFAKGYLDLNLFGHEIQPDMVQGINPVLIILLLAPVTLLWRLLGHLGWNLRPTDKMLVGFVLTIVGMGTMTAAGFLTTPEHKVSVLWEFAAYVVITVAEICISVVGLELAFTAAPKHMKSFVTACWLFTVFLGNVLDMAIARFYTDLGPAKYFGALTVLMVGVTIAFAIVASRFNRLIEQPEIAAVVGDKVNPVE